MDGPIRLQASLREKVWGRTQLAPWFADSAEKIGEAWYLTDRELPLLVKLIFTSERLSVQVHPDDGEDGPRGKTEMWHILAADAGATIALGFREPLTRERLQEATLSGEIEHLVNWVPVKAGDTYFTPAHTVHAIGAGIVLCEIQQNSDVTYRLWDYGRPRPLHIEQAVPISELTVHPGAAIPTPIGRGHDALVWSKHFITEMVRLEAGDEFTPSAENCQLWICIEGAGAIGGQAVRAGEVWLLPEERELPPVTGDGVSFLRTYVPE
ncbi:MAG TPA: class I mannose-6-phosphate isomerase [Bryobacteraceae bacterium]|jgi:mannose-6-phosphate isomerase|nr:class I mannose-6-phosphate isomerase [Bryobacteraceae bacterium]